MKRKALLIITALMIATNAIGAEQLERYNPNAPKNQVPAPTGTLQDKPIVLQTEKATQAPSKTEFKKFDINSDKKPLSAVVPKKKKKKKISKKQEIQQETPKAPTSELLTTNEPPRYIDIQAILAKGRVIQVEEKKEASQVAQIERSTMKPEDSIKVAANNVYTFIEGSIYTVWCKKGFVTDIQLQPGERITQPPIGGDTKRWIIDNGTSGGNGSLEVEHIYIRPIEDGLVGNIIISTDKRSYHLKAIASENAFTPLVSWLYPADEKRELAFSIKIKEKEKAEITTEEATDPESINFNYKIKSNSGMFSSDYNWTPLKAFDNGVKTYLQTNPMMRNNESPALFVKDRDGKLNLVNYRLKNNYFIIDRLFESAELRNGVEEIVTITKEKK